MSVTQSPGFGQGRPGGGNVPGTKSNQQNERAAVMKLNMLMAESFVKMGNSLKNGIVASQNGDQMAAQRAAHEMMIARKELMDVKKAMSMMAQPPEQDLAGSPTGVPQGRPQSVDAVTGRPMDTNPDVKTI